MAFLKYVYSLAMRTFRTKVWVIVLTVIVMNMAACGFRIVITYFHLLILADKEYVHVEVPYVYSYLPDIKLLLAVCYNYVHSY